MGACLAMRGQRGLSCAAPALRRMVRRMHTHEAPCNAVGVQLLERALHRQVFPPGSTQIPPVDPCALDLCQDHLHRHGLHASKASKLSPTSFELPPLLGKDLGEHFWTMGRRLVHPWMAYAETLARTPIPRPPRPEADMDADADAYWDADSWLALDASLQPSVPLRPAALSTEPGWTKYAFLRTSQGTVAGLGPPEAVPYPDVEDAALVFDVETMPRVSSYPVMASAVGQHAWYTWISPWLVQRGERHTSPAHLIPMGPRDGSAPPRLLVGHHAGYDRAAVLDEYSLHMTHIRWLDTMSLHVATNGISSPQRAAWTEHARRRAMRRLDAWLTTQRRERDTQEQIKALLDESDLDDDAFAALRMHVHDVASDAPDDEESQVLWQDVTSQNSLADVAALHCGIHLDKDARNVFVESTCREEVASQLAPLLAYCASDVHTTCAVFAKVWPAFLRSCPHPATLAGVLGLGSTFLPVDASWQTYRRETQAKFEQMNARVVSTLKHLATALMESGVAAIDAQSPDRWWETDPWYAQLDWSPKRPKVHDEASLVPLWWRDKIARVKRGLSARSHIVVQLLQLRCDGDAVVYDAAKRRWTVERGGQRHPLPSSPLAQTMRQRHTITSEAGADVLAAVLHGDGDAAVRALALSVRDAPGPHPALAQLDWTKVPYTDANERSPWWPKWYWDLYDARAGEIDVTIRAKIAPLLLKIAWDGMPIYRSREHGWIYQSPQRIEGKAPLVFSHAADAALQHGLFYKLPHADGDGSNVGNPFSKGFLPLLESGRLQSLHPSRASGDAARGALEMNAQCSYWISARDRIERQVVVWEGEAETRMGFAPHDERRGLILPQVITMGTVTRRAIEKTWLTASNAKRNRIGSELKSMVKAPRGWSIVGADVDSEELWICSVMGDAQFGIHGATAIGWMTLEGSKAQGTDLHSKTASILGTQRDQAKVFNYSRIYGAGIRHAMHLLLKANPSMQVDEAARRAKQLYAATKGQATRGDAYFGRRFWYGGSESFVFNKLEEIALSEHPRTPALDCGITAALSRQYLPRARGEQQDYMPSRINWVVQSSGVDYLHLLITAMGYLCATYGIDARFMLSVHDEVRYLARDDDKYRAALALQIANLWTRAMFAFKLNMDDLPESCAFFAAVDIDHVLRKEVDDPCVTPSQPDPIPPGESLDMAGVLAKAGGSLHRRQGVELPDPGWPAYVPSMQQHRCVGEAGLLFLQAQAATDIDEIRALHRRRQRSPSHVRSYATSARKPPVLGTLAALKALLPPRPLRRVRRPRQRARRKRSKPARAPRPMPRIHLSGALLPPSLYNKPMLRYKPTQPLHMTMMIRARRRARQRRLQRWDELQEIKFLLGNDDAWYDTYKPYERELQAQFQRERERAQMVFTPEQLRVAKAARRARLARHMARRTRQDTPPD